MTVTITHNSRTTTYTATDAVVVTPAAIHIALADHSHLVPQHHYDADAHSSLQLYLLLRKAALIVRDNNPAVDEFIRRHARDINYMIEYADTMTELDTLTDTLFRDLTEGR